jgi:hypothetical protein
MNAMKPELDILDVGIDEDCPICARNPPFNAKTLAAIAEGEAILRGEIPAKWYHSLEEARKDMSM